MTVKTPASFQIANKINGFEHVSYGTALNLILHLADMTLFRRALNADLTQLRKALGDKVTDQTSGDIAI